ncbi:MAG: oligosaccharide flippase family protein [Oscillospiraceae bacterium]|nr:oligosaccharide flippase family protein [Oscillospiraceae bacterium]
MSKRNAGMILGYVLIVVEVVVGMLFTPTLLNCLGSDEYGLYKLLVSWTSIISVLDLGLGGTITRYVIKYKTDCDAEGESNFLGMAFRIYGIIACAILIIGGIAGFILPSISSGIALEYRHEAQIAFSILVVKTAALILNHAYTGWFTAYELFTVNRLLSIGNIALRLVLVSVMLPLVPSVYTVVCVDAGLTIIQLILNSVLSRKMMAIRPSVKKWDWTLAKEILGYTLSLFLMTVINQFNSNVDNVVLGIFSTTTMVGLYSCSMQIYTMYSSLSTAVQEVYLPSISEKVFKGESDDAITLSLVEPSRIQVSVLLLALSGYILFGKHFFNIWIGNSYSDEEINLCYLVGLLVMASATVQLFQNTTTCVLKAKNMMRGRVMIIGISTVVNFILTVFLTQKYGMVGAAIGTAVSMVGGYTIAVNIYYKIRIGINTGLYFRETLRGLWLAVLIAFTLGILTNVVFESESLIIYIIKAIIYIVLYAGLLYLIGFTKSEKNRIKEKLSSVCK